MDSARLRFLISNNLLMSFEEAVVAQPRFVVVTGFGFGIEYWAVDDANYEYDEPRYASKYIVAGKCIDFTGCSDPLRQIRGQLRSEVLFVSVD